MAVLTYRSTELRNLSGRRCWFSIVEGWKDGVAVRVPETVIPGKSGQVEETAVVDKRVVRLHGLVLGTSETNWNTVRGELEAIFDPSLAAANLIVTSPYLGLASGTKTLSARVESVRTTEQVDALVTEYDVILNAIGSPPDWS